MQKNNHYFKGFESSEKTNQIASLIFGICTIFGVILYFVLRTIDQGYISSRVVIVCTAMGIFAVLPYVLSKITVRQSLITHINAVIFSSTYVILILGDREASNLTLWSSIFVLVILSLMYSNRIVLSIVSLTSLSLFAFISFQEPDEAVKLNIADHLGRIGILSMVIAVAFYINYLLRQRLYDNDKKLNEMSLQRDEIEALYEEITATEEELRDKYDELVNYQESLRQSEDRYKKIFEASNEALFEWDLDSNKKFLSENWFSIFDLDTEGEFLIEEWFAKIHPEDLSSVFKNIERLKKGEISIYETEFRYQNVQREYNWFSSKFVGISNNKGDTTNLLGAFINIHEKKTQQDELVFIASHDVLTGLPNKIWFIDYFSSLLKENKSGFLILMDIDNFKYINDVFGHPVGDIVLRLLSNNIKKQGNDFTIAKFGGDEFICCISGGERNFKEAYDNILEIVNTPIQYKDQEFILGISSGVVEFNNNAQDVHDYIKKAEIAMYKAKELGKNNWVIFDEKMNEQVIRTSKLENGLKNALHSHEFMVYYQPQYLIKGKKLFGYEALIRWYNPEFGFVTPDSFIGLAETTGIINDIGYFVINEACKFILELDERGWKDITISVNVSPIQLSNQMFEDKVMNIIEYYGIRPERLCFEVTETAVMQSFKDNVDKLARLRKKGFKISLDDFGTGYSSLSYLKSIPVSEVKIDRSFINDICKKDEMNVKLVRAIIEISHDFGFKVVAEGVEENSQLDMLAGMNCDMVQGYLFSKPVPSEEALRISDNCMQGV
ncbi:sensor domain-containing protein [Pseudobacteroides cellulosolvens]|uniref:Diguanylate cyclase/phosphodiesterase with PAS/PAC sensor(S) n=1 Tax=Pseudobacteroides cellulosolvens ATCC 35603 = DSM 2933 TaxID=398512 RepID=A0A0L6JP31_9FIRM|nr:EAL domain-containing protein [Pseudobacteroides cellulosolvens]KNY27538.1 diguanylate cyclase/phosphodiesterase with PAS/PAC sensor(s) [Pseudobacteroides cellulosolvens ATCC 35603 = DSM 2933]